MVGDGVNDAPAPAQANVGIAMGTAGSDVAIEAAHIAVMHEDWTLVPELFRIARRTMRVVKMNIGFTAIYNVLGLTLATLGILPPILAAASQSLPDLGILANSSRLLRHERIPNRQEVVIASTKKIDSVQDIAVIDGCGGDCWTRPEIVPVGAGSQMISLDSIQIK